MTVKHTPSTDALETLGNIILPTEKRDAIHLAVDPAMTEARAWIYNFAEGLGLGYDELIEAAGDYLNHGDYLVKGGDLEGEYVPDEFWDHYQVVKKEKVDENDRGSFFSCSC